MALLPPERIELAVENLKQKFWEWADLYFAVLSPMVKELNRLDAVSYTHLDVYKRQAVRTLMKLNGSTAVDFSALDAEFSALQSGSAEPVSYTHLDVYKRQIGDRPNIEKHDIKKDDCETQHGLAKRSG